MNCVQFIACFSQNLFSQEYVITSSSHSKPENPFSFSNFEISIQNLFIFICFPSEDIFISVHTYWNMHAIYVKLRSPFCDQHWFNKVIESYVYRQKVDSQWGKWRRDFLPNMGKQLHILISLRVSLFGQAKVSLHLLGDSVLGPTTSVDLPADLLFLHDYYFV